MSSPGKYRGLRDANGKWVHGWYVEWNGHSYIEFSRPDCSWYDNIRVEVRPETVAQYTGEDGIWGDDILTFSVFDMHDSDTQYRGVAKFADGEWQLWNIDDKNGMYGDDGPFSLHWVLLQDVEAEVIGDIHTTPQLMEGK